MNTFLIVGQTGVGKSSFVNSTFGIRAAETNDYKACTTVVKQYAYGTPYGDVCLIDTPGLGEDEEADTDVKYLRMINSQVDLRMPTLTMLYLTPLNETRFRGGEKRGIALITRELGLAIWTKSWLMFTFAASVPAEKRETAHIERARQISEYVRQVENDIGLGKMFTGFQRIYLMDNKVRNWDPRCVPAASVLTTP